MRSRRMTFGRVAALGAILVVAVGCGNSSATWPGARTGGPSASDDKRAAAPSIVRTAEPEATGARATAAAVTIDQITVDYTYKSPLITPIAHLYGTKLSDFVIVTIKNDNSQSVKVVVTSEISGFTSKAIDTVTVAANGTKRFARTRG